MKTFPSALTAHYAAQERTEATALRITRADAVVFAITTHDVPVTIDSVYYESAPGLDVTSIEQTAGTGVDNLELSVFGDDSVFTAPEALGGAWRNAAFEIFRYNWSSPGDGKNTLVAGTVGEVTLRNGAIVSELRGLQQYLQQPVGNVSTKTCRTRLGSAACGVNLAGYTFSATLTGVTSRQVFTATALGQATNYFTEGLLTWTSGANSGLSQKVKAFAAGGVITLSLPMLSPVLAGDGFDIVAGCTKRIDEDCAAKFGNVLNFQGEPHRPTLDDLVKPVEPSV